MPHHHGERGRLTHCSNSQGLVLRTLPTTPDGPLLLPELLHLHAMRSFVLRQDVLWNPTPVSELRVAVVPSPLAHGAEPLTIGRGARSRTGLRLGSDRRRGTAGPTPATDARPIARPPDHGLHRVVKVLGVRGAEVERVAIAVVSEAHALLRLDILTRLRPALIARQERHRSLRHKLPLSLRFLPIAKVDAPASLVTSGAERQHPGIGRQLHRGPNDTPWLRAGLKPVRSPFGHEVPRRTRAARAGERISGTQKENETRDAAKGCGWASRRLLAQHLLSPKNRGGGLRRRLLRKRDASRPPENRDGNGGRDSGFPATGKEDPSPSPRRRPLQRPYRAGGHDLARFFFQEGQDEPLVRVWADTVPVGPSTAMATPSMMATALSTSASSGTRTATCTLQAGADARSPGGQVAWCKHQLVVPNRPQFIRCSLELGSRD